MITREFNLYLHAGHSIPLVINVNQYDHGEQWLFTLFNSDGTQYVPSSGAIVGIKSDNLGIINTGSVDAQGRVVINETQQMTASVGKAVFELVIDDGTHGTANFVVLVEEKPGNNADLSESDISMIEEAIEAASTIKPYGSPLVASTVAGMTDHEKVYVYVGSETGYTSGNWYYWDGSAWTSGGVYNSAAVQTDTTLTLSGVAADAKKTGDEISDLKSDLNEADSALDKLDDSVFYTSDNLYDYTQSKANQIPNSWSGATYNDFSTLNGWKTSNLIPVEEGESYCVIENGNLKNSYTVDFYNSAGSFLSKVEMNRNTTVVAPSGAVYMYMFKNGTNPNFSSPNLAIKKYSESMDYIVRPFGKSERYITNPYTYGLYKTGDNYYHFTKIADSRYLVRHFVRFGINNLLDLKGMYYGDIANNVLSIGGTIGTTTTDTIGPVSINRGSADSYIGSWSGGVHGITVDGVEYPTAEQTDLKVYCNGTEITDDGLYWGKVTLVATNDLYFPKTVTGSDLSTATKAVKEIRRYELAETMKVKVALSFYATTIITQYYGCQCTPWGMTTLRFPNNETVQNISRSSNYVGTNKETTLVADNSNSHYAVSVKGTGLGTFAKNNGTASDVGYCYLATFNKFYFVLIANESGVVRRATTDSHYYWEGEYNYYID